MATHAGVHIAWMSLCLLLSHADHNRQSFVCFPFLYKNTSACYTHYWGEKKEEETQNSYLRADLKSTT